MDPHGAPGPPPPSTRCPLKEEGVGTVPCRSGQMCATRTGGGRGLTDVRKALNRPQPRPGPNTRRVGGGPASWDWLAKCERPRRLWRGFGESRSPIKGLQQAAHRAPPGPAILAIQAQLSPLHALAPKPEQPGLSVPPQKRMARWQGPQPEFRR